MESMDVHDGRSKIASKEVGCIDGVADKMAIVVAFVCVCVRVLVKTKLKSKLCSCIPHIMTV